MSEKEKNETMEVAVVGGFATLSNMKEMNEAMMEDLAGMKLTFDRIKIPSGGSTAFEIPDADTDDTKMVKDITGVILLHHPAYAYYSKKYVGGSNPPDCGSFDGVKGNGTPGGTCATCPYNKYGSGEGQGKACKNRRMIYILMEGEFFPMVLSLPTGSLKEFQKYVKRQLSKARKLCQIVTKISLRKATNSSGIVFSQAVFSFERELTTAEKTAVWQMADQARTYAANLSMSALAPVDEVPFVDAETGKIVEPLK